MVEVYYKTTKKNEASVKRAELPAIYAKLSDCMKAAGIKKYWVRPCKSIPPKGGGGDDPITVMPDGG